MSKPYIISIVDDDEIYQFAMRKDLEELDIPKRILTFSDGGEALDFLTDNMQNEEDLPDIIFLDINMPVMDGFEFMEEFVLLKPSVGKAITIYMVSSSVDPADIERAQAISEISDYIVKPVELSKLGDLVKQLKREGDL